MGKMGLFVFLFAVMSFSHHGLAAKKLSYKKISCQGEYKASKTVKEDLIVHVTMTSVKPKNASDPDTEIFIKLFRLDGTLFTPALKDTGFAVHDDNMANKELEAIAISSDKDNFSKGYYLVIDRNTLKGYGIFHDSTSDLSAMNCELTF